MTTNEIATTDDVQRMNLDARMEYAEQLATSGLIPTTFQKHPENVLVAIEWGRELGLSPIAAMKEIYVVHGQPSLSAKSMLGLARKAGHRVRIKGEDQQATCEIVRADDPEYTHSVTYTLDDAKRAGLLGNTGWKNHPSTMLRWRAASECIRMACPEVLGGISYTPEEIQEARARNASRLTAEVIPQVKADRSVSDYMRALKLSGKDLKAFSGRVLGENVESWEGLTDEQRSAVTDALAQWEANGEDPTTVEQADGELIDPETGEVQP